MEERKKREIGKSKLKKEHARVEVVCENRKVQMNK